MQKFSKKFPLTAACIYMRAGDYGFTPGDVLMDDMFRTVKGGEIEAFEVEDLAFEPMRFPDIHKAKFGDLAVSYSDKWDNLIVRYKGLEFQGTDEKIRTALRTIQPERKKYDLDDYPQSIDFLRFAFKQGAFNVFEGESFENYTGEKNIDLPVKGQSVSVRFEANFVTAKVFGLPVVAYSDENLLIILQSPMMETHGADWQDIVQQFNSKSW